MKKLYEFYIPKFRMTWKISLFMVLVSGLSFGVSNAQTYCTPSYTSGCSFGDEINDFSLTGDNSTSITNNSSGCSSNGYGDYTSLSAPDLTPGQSYTGSVSTDYLSPSDEYVHIWIDYNDDDTFSANEAIAAIDGLGSTGSSFTFSVSPTADSGNHRMRVRLVWLPSSASAIDPCTNESYGETEDYLIHIVALSACSGQPDAGAIDTTATFGVCGGIPFSITDTGATSGSGMTYQWQQRVPAGTGAWTDIAGANSFVLYLPNGIADTTDFRFYLVCNASGLSDTSNMVTATLNLPGNCYCTPFNSTNVTYYIDDFSTSGGVSNITNNSSGFSSAGYGNYTGTDTVSAYGGMQISVSASADPPTYTNYFYVWVDWNHNGNFSDPGELVLTTSTYVSSPFTGTFAVPVNAAIGYTRLRIRQSYINVPTPCGSDDYGEAEDYTFWVQTMPNCSTGTLPSPLAAKINADTLCVSGDVSLDLDSAIFLSGLTYQWQQSADGSSGWANIGLGQDSSHMVLNAVDTSAWYRCELYCSGSVIFTSNTVAVHVNDPMIVGLPSSGFNCGTGSVTLSATPTSGASLSWYDSPTATTALDTGNVFVTPSLTATDTFYVAAFIKSGSNTGVRITEMNIGGPDGLEIENVSGNPIDVTGWTVAISNNYTDITSVNTIVQTLSGTMQSGDIKSWTDQSTNTNYWGNNILWDPTGKGWVLLLDDDNNIVDFVSQDWDATDVQSASVSVSSVSISLSNAWTGAGLVGSTVGTNSFQRTGSSDNDDAADFTTATPSVGTQNSSISLPFSGLGGTCESARQPVIATIYPPAPVVNLGADTSFCAGLATIFLDAGNPGDSYLWSTGATTQTFSTSSTGTFYVSVSDANGCVGSDTIHVLSAVVPTSVLPATEDLCNGGISNLDAGNPGSSYLWSNGATTQSINVQAGGDYTVKITSASNCSVWDTVSVAVLPVPIVNIGNDTVLCTGDTIMLDAGNPGASYTWNTGAATELINVTGTGNFIVTVTGTNNCSTNDSITISQALEPLVTLPSTLDLCNGDTATLDAGNIGSSYSWSTGSTSQSVDVSSGGDYSVMVTNTSGCRINMTTQVTLRPLPVINLGEDQSFCPSEGITLNAGNPGSLYSWNTGDSSQTIYVTDSGTYQVTVTTVPYGCSSSDSVHLALEPLPYIGGITSVLNPDSSFTFGVYGLHDANSYFWNFGDGSTSADQSPTHIYASSGSYEVILVLTNDCGSDTFSIQISFIKTGVHQFELNQEQLTLYPNPARDLVTLNNESTYQMQSVIVYNILGQVIYRGNTNNVNSFSINVQNYASGMYNVKIIMKDGSWLQRKFEIRR